MSKENSLSKKTDMAPSAATYYSSHSGISRPAVKPFQLKSSSGTNVIQAKGRIDLSKIEEGKREMIRKEIEQFKQEKRTGKKGLTINWATSDSKDDTHGKEDDITYNNQIEEIRKKYEQQIRHLAETQLPDVKDAYISGDQYYGDQQGTDNHYIRSDNKKEYVRDKRGTFIPRYVRRELNRNDTGPVSSGQNLNPTGISTYKDLLDKRKVSDITGVNPNDTISADHREFLQQSTGGGNNQFAFSHTSTKRPILSNDHLSFGTYPNGAILTDLKMIPRDEIAAQWGTDEQYGHKVKLKEDAHVPLGNEDQFKQRDQVVIMSGYRNKEIITNSIPHTSIVRNPSHKGWGGPDVKENIQQDDEYKGNYDALTTKEQELTNYKTLLEQNKKDTEAKEREINALTNKINGIDYALTKNTNIPEKRAKELNENKLKLEANKQTVSDEIEGLKKAEEGIKNNIQTAESDINRYKILLRNAAYDSGESTRGTLMEEERIALKK
ncbi:hypothetical protein [Chitinophaga rhizophila]|uniref:Uncharacterized protein n=1 Tax=Chitinophaga rhizophila TaxID=2866212 RepID=A0ABS7G664_9BACT|nr:hypothetical protein [Chitinophaga rhizophila]MBW8683133.1 hypothetical protein [Chitinophaga rhizophila]